MRSLISRIVLLGVALLAPIAVCAQQVTTRSVNIHVSDQLGAPIKGAQVQIVPAPDAISTKLETDQRGNLSLKLKSGGYGLVVSAQGFKNWCERIYVAAPDGEATASQTYPVVLQIGDMGSPTFVYPRDVLVLRGDARHTPVALSQADFRAMPHTTITVRNSHTNADESYSGVLLVTLLGMVNAPIGKEMKNEGLSSYLIASGLDGYAVVLSLAEVDPNFRDGHVLVADARNGLSLGKSGPFQLIVPEDKRPARWVHNLVSISLQGVR